MKEDSLAQPENHTKAVDRNYEMLPYKYPEHLLATLASVQPIAEIVKTQLDETLDCRYVCTACGRSYKHQFHLKAHRRECSQEPMFECPECTRRFYHSRNLSRHLQNVHKKPQVPPQKVRRRSSKKEQLETTKEQTSKKEQLDKMKEQVSKRVYKKKPQLDKNN